MIDFLKLAFHLLISPFRTQARSEAEMVLLQHQPNVLRQQEEPEAAPALTFPSAAGHLLLPMRSDSRRWLLLERAFDFVSRARRGRGKNCCTPKLVLGGASDGFGMGASGSGQNYGS
jgi:hypothetical protein